MKLQSKEERYLDGNKVREGQVRELVTKIAERMRSVVAAGFKLAGDMLPEFHLKRERENAALGCSVDYRDGQRPQAFISERADIGTVARMIVTLLLSVDNGPQDVKSKDGSVTRKYVRRGYADKMKALGLGGKPTLVELGAMTDEVMAYIAAMSKVRGSYVTSGEKPAEKKTGGENFVAFKLEDCTVRATLTTIETILACIKAGRVPTIELPDSVKEAIDERAKVAAEKVADRDTFKAELVNNGKARKTSKARKVSADIAANASAAPTANADNGVSAAN